MNLVFHISEDGSEIHGKKLRVVENRIEQCCAAHIVQCCQQYCSALLHLIAGWIQA